jgi:hypothetical protein
MSQEWHDELKSRGAFAAGLAQEIPILLKDRTISAAQVAVLLDSLIKNTERFDAFVEQMKNCEADQSLVSSAESIQRIYVSILETVTNRLTVLQKRR